MTLPETLQLFGAVAVNISSTWDVPCSRGRQTHRDRDSNRDRETETYREKSKRSQMAFDMAMGRKTINKIRVNKITFEGKRQAKG